MNVQGKVKSSISQSRSGVLHACVRNQRSRVNILRGFEGKFMSLERSLDRSSSKDQVLRRHLCPQHLNFQLVLRLQNPRLSVRDWSSACKMIVNMMTLSRGGLEKDGNVVFRTKIRDPSKGLQLCAHASDPMELILSFRYQKVQVIRDFFLCTQLLLPSVSCCDPVSRLLQLTRCSFHE